MFDTYQRYLYPYNFFLKKRKNIKNLLDLGANGAGFARYNIYKIPQTNVDVVKPRKNEIEQFSFLKYVVYDGGKLPFGKGCFDLLLCIDTLEHIPPNKRRKFVQEALRVTNKYAIFTFPINTSEKYENILRKIFPQNKFLQEHKHFSLPKDEEFKQMIISFGYSLVEEKNNINVYLWIPIKLISSFLYRLLKNNHRLSFKLFLLYKSTLAHLINFGTGYSKTYLIVKNEYAKK